MYTAPPRRSPKRTRSWITALGSRACRPHGSGVRGGQPGRVAASERRQDSARPQTDCSVSAGCRELQAVRGLNLLPRSPRQGVRTPRSGIARLQELGSVESPKEHLILCQVGRPNVAARRPKPDGPDLWDKTLNSCENIARRRKGMDWKLAQGPQLTSLAQAHSLAGLRLAEHTVCPAGTSPSCHSGRLSIFNAQTPCENLCPTFPSTASQRSHCHPNPPHQREPLGASSTASPDPSAPSTDSSADPSLHRISDLDPADIHGNSPRNRLLDKDLEAHNMSASFLSPPFKPRIRLTYHSHSHPSPSCNCSTSSAGPTPS